MIDEYGKIFVWEIGFVSSFSLVVDLFT